MLNEYYQEAFKSAQKEYRRCLSRGQYPYLPVLDMILQEDRLTTGVEVGLVQVPSELIVGTRTEGRTRSFAANFMPLLKEDTEFAAKWKSLCNAHLEEGIRDAVKVYEYMNRYYVEEGNKRVSVLKFFGAVTIPAEVIRIYPENREDEEKDIYCELLEFEKQTGIYFIEFQKKGRYEELLQVLGKGSGEKWSEDERKQFASVYYFFLRVYRSTVGKMMSSSPADALLAYIKIFGYQSLKQVGEAELKKNLARLGEDISLMKEDAPIQLNLQPEEEKKGNLINQVLNIAAPKPRNIAFIHDKTKEESGWTNNHEMGRMHVQQVFDGRVRTTAYFQAMQRGPKEVIEQAIAEGNQVIFTTSPQLLQASLQAAVEHPDIIILNCSLNKPHRHIRTYYGRMYEAKFIAGAISGSLSENGKVGYVCNYPIYGQIAGINAFALGAQMANPKAKVYLRWSSLDGLKHAVKQLTDQGIHLISSIESVPMNEDNYKFFGLFGVEQDKMTSLAVPLWQWGIYYEEIIRRILDGSFQQEYEESHKALNYYWGMSAGVIDILCGGSLPESTRKLAWFLKESIRKGNCNPFMGSLHTQDGRVIELKDQTITMDQIINMDYLVENVVGDIPPYEELSPAARATVDIMGVEKVVKHE